jgi:hypothetical protein
MLNRLKRISSTSPVRPRKLILVKQIYADYTIKARQRGIDFQLELAYFVQLIQRDCIYCGSRPTNLKKDKHGHQLYYQGIDRVLNDEGYNLENAVPCCHRCNRMKSDMLTPREMLAAIKAIKKLK